MVKSLLNNFMACFDCDLNPCPLHYQTNALQDTQAELICLPMLGVGADVVVVVVPLGGAGVVGTTTGGSNDAMTRTSIRCSALRSV